MPSNPPANMPRITPYLLYEDVEAALEYLGLNYGFVERMRIPGEDGKPIHAKMELADGVIMMGNPGPDYESPRRIGKSTQLIYVYVEDVDAHYEQAKAGGAVISTEPEDQFYGDRNYRTEDCEGHQWTFAQHVRDVSLDDL